VSSEGRLIVLSRRTDGEPTSRDDLSFRRATTTDAAAYARDVGTDATSSFRARLSSPAMSCYLVLDGNSIVHATWCTTGAAWTREIRRYFCPPPGDAYVYESFTRPEVRGRGVYPFALSSIAADLERAGVPRVWVAVEADNHASLRAVGKGGFSPVDEIGFRRRLGRVAVTGASGPETLRIVPKSAVQEVCGDGQAPRRGR
jgi:ribosomal protein S18 acetylase RimI-like enzyme